MSRYERQDKTVDQAKLSGATVLVAGLGGLGSPVAMYLASAGVGTLILVDRDKLEESNLNRQILYTESDLGKPKSITAEKRIKALNSTIKVKSSQKITENLIKKSDIIVDCFDNWESRTALWKVALKNKKIVVHGGIEKKYGQIAILVSEKDAKLIPRPKPKSEKPQVMGATAGIIGSRMAMEVINIIENPPKTSKVLDFDGTSFTKYTIGKSKGFTKWNAIVIRVSEIWLKSRTTKSWMAKRLIKNISDVVPDCRIQQESTRLLVSPFTEAAVEKIRHIFGVKSLSPVLKVPLDELEARFREVVRLTVNDGEKFRVTVQRQNKAYPMTSMKLQAELGRIVKEEVPEADVNLKNFDHNLEVEIHKDSAHIFTKRVDGPGGMPEGAEGRALALFSGGIDSPVAAWMVGKRGVSIDFLFMNPLGPVLETKVHSVYEAVKPWFPNSKLYVINTSEAVNQITSKVNEGERQTILKRFLYRLAEKVACMHGYSALITGESIGQASSQTLQSIAVLHGAVKIPVLRPLVGMDKEETISIAKKIGSYEASSQIPEFCSIETHSNAHPKKQKILEIEENLSFDYDRLASGLRLSKKMEIEAMKPPENWGGFEIVYLLKRPGFSAEKGKKYIFVCKKAHKASEMAYKARQLGIEAYAVSYSDAVKRGLKL